ncbi:MAG: glycosyltransferase family 2 protein [Candidatus Bathyarchaeia archaeon]
MSTFPLISVICCAHNEEEYVDKSVPKIVRALKGLPSEIIFVADRCTDRTVEKARKYSVRLIQKKWRRWKNSYAESLQTGYHETKGTYISVIDADIAVPSNFFRDLIPMMKGEVVSIGSRVVVYPDTLWNRVMYAWERTREIAPLGTEPRGAARIVLRKALDDINGFRDVPAPDTDIDIRLAKRGYKSMATSAVTVYHVRHLSFKKMVDGQIKSGRGRYALRSSIVRTVGHAVFRLRPFVVGGWFFEWIESKRPCRDPKEIHK